MRAADYRARTKDVPKGVKLLSTLTLGFFTPLIPVLGMDIAGIVESVESGVTAFHPGDEVIAMLNPSSAGTRSTSPSRRTAPLPANPPTCRSRRRSPSSSVESLPKRSWTK